MRTIKNTRMKPAEIHNGERTHHQDQEITPVNFSATNKTVRREVNPTPVLLLDDVLDMMSPR